MQLDPVSAEVVVGKSFQTLRGQAKKKIAYPRFLGAGLFDVALAGAALFAFAAAGAGGGGGASALKMSSATFHCPFPCFFHTVTYFPFSFIGFPAASFIAI